ncbi:MAG TPA: protein kinase [Planctomycetota bacterium]
MPPVPDPQGELENLLAEALARFDEGGEPAMAAFVAAHADHAIALERGIRRCREMGLLGALPGAASSAHPDRLGDFRLLRRIGGGGMGVVYEAVQEPLGRRVALKIIRPELLFFEGARERFRREIDAIARLEHPAIVSVFSAGEHDGVPYFTMEMIDGITVDQACTGLHDRDPAELRGEDLRALLVAPDATGVLFTGSWWEAAVRVGHQVALGLRHAHLRGIVHRDIKPSNIIVTPHGQAIVLDFGVAQVRSASDLTRSGATPGSPAFMSPEQRRGQATDERTDVFSLAASIWQMLTLRRPFRDGDVVHVDPVLQGLRAQNRAVPPELDLVLRTAMDRDRDRRYGDMGAFAEDLQALLDRRPIRARPLGLRLRALRWCQRHRTLATASGLLAAAGALMLVVLLVVQERARADLEAANRLLAAAKAEVETEQLRTRESLDTTLEALHSGLVRLGNDQLRAVPQAERVAHGMLQDAAALFRVLLRRHPDDEQVRWRGGRALHALAMSYERQGQMGKARQALDEAITVLGTEQPGSATLRNVRGHAWKTMASWIVHDDDAAATQRALEHAEADFADDSRDPARRAETLRALSDLSSTRSFTFDERADPKGVEHHLRQAVERQRACMALGVADEKDPELLVMRLTNLGKFLQRQDRVEEALAVLGEALELSKSLPERSWPPPAVYTAEVQEAIGSALVNRKDPGAEPLLRECVAARERAVEQFPDNLEFRIRLAGSVHNLGRFLHVLERTEEALATFRQARAIQEQALAKSPQHPVALDFMGKHLEMIGYCHSLRREGQPLIEVATALSALPSRDPRRALRVADFQLRAWLFLGKSDGGLLDAAMAQLVVAEQRGLTAAQLPARGFEALEGREDYRSWRERVGKVGPAAK